MATLLKLQPASKICVPFQCPRALKRCPPWLIALLYLKGPVYALCMIAEMPRAVRVADNQFWTREMHSNSRVMDWDFYVGFDREVTTRVNANTREAGEPTSKAAFCRLLSRKIRYQDTERKIKCLEASGVI